jgi:hypothetical protein
MILSWLLRSTLCVVIVSSCTNRTSKEGTALTSSEPKKRAAEKDSSSVEHDCVFNDDYQGLTDEWLKEINKNNFVWKSDINRAVVIDGPDSIFLSKGGCGHFGISVELRIPNDRHLISDSTFWIERTLRLADEFGMDHYSKAIRSKSLRKVQDSPTKIWFEVEDDAGDDNLYYDGIEVCVEGGVSRIGISQYYN